MRGTSSKTALFAVAMVTLSSSAEAQWLPPTRPGQDALRTEEAKLDAQLRAAEASAQRWHYSWTGIFAAGLASRPFLIGFAANDRKTRWAQVVGSTPPVVGFTLQLALPLAALDLEDDLAAMPRTSLRRRVDHKRRLLHRYADSEADQRDWFAHAGPAFLNTATAGVLLWGFHEPLQAGLTLGIGMALSQAKVWTSPQAATEALEGEAPEEAAWSVTPVAGPGYWGLAGTF